MSSGASLSARTAKENPKENLDNLSILTTTTATTSQDDKQSTSTMPPSTIQTAVTPNPMSDIVRDVQGSDRGRPETELCARCQGSGLHHIDKLVEDLISSENELERERKRQAEKDAEISKLKQELAKRSSDLVESQQQCERSETRVRELEQTDQDKDVGELRRLLAFHVAQGEKLSRQFKDLQATNKKLEVSLRSKEATVDEQAALLEGFGLQWAV